MKSKKLFLQNNNRVITNLFERMGFSVVHSPKEKYDCAVLLRYVPVHPVYYGQVPIKDFPLDQVSMERDRNDWNFIRSLDFNKPKLGIGTGAHMLNVACGGDMWQRVDGHLKATDGHEVKLFNNHVHTLSSWHGQMMNPSKYARVIGKAKSNSKREKFGETVSLKDNKWEDPEIVYYSYNNALCFQPMIGIPKLVEAEKILSIAMQGCFFS